MSRTLGLALLALAARGECQEVVWEQVGIPNATSLGGITAVLGDVDGDGYRDLVSILASFAQATREYQIQLGVFSGRDGRLLRRRPMVLGYLYQTLAAAGDHDGDGVGDYVVTLRDQLGVRDTVVQVCSGRDDHVIWQVTNTWASAFGSALLGDLDLDGDHRPDVVMTAPVESGFQGAVYAYASPGRLLYRLAGTQQRPIGVRADPTTLGRVGDVDGDGADDFVAGGADRTTPIASGAAFLVSGRTGQILFAGLDELPGDGIGVAVDGCGDMDRDGTPDFVAISTPRSATQDLVIRAYSGRTGSPIRTWRTSTVDPCFGHSLASGGIDVDLDGVPDVLNGGGFCGSLFVLSGRDGSVIYRDTSQGGGFGAQVIPIGVQPGSPFSHLATVHGDYQRVCCALDYRGRLLVYRGSPPSGEVFGIPCRAGLPAAPRIGMRSLGQSGVRITVHDGPPGPAALLIGLSRTQFGGLALPFPLAGFGLPGCSLYTAPDLALVTDLGTSGLARGYAALDLTLPILATGTPLFVQWWCLGVSGVGAVSDAASWRF